jgi:hypothetical protein
VTPEVTALANAATGAASSAAAYATQVAGVLGAVDTAGSSALEGQRYAAEGSVLTNLPAHVHAAEQLLKQAVWWIDAASPSAGSQTVENLGYGGSVLNATVGSSTGNTTNDPKYLSWEGENYVYLPGLGSNYLSVPDEAALRTGDLDLRVRIAADTWPLTANSVLMSRVNGAAGTLAWRWNLNTDGTMSVITYLADGSTTVVWAPSSVMSAMGPGTTLWLRVTCDADNGASKRVVTYYTSTDGNVWTQLSTNSADANTVINTTAGSGIEIGVRNATNGPIAAKIYRAQILSGINGSVVLDVDCTQITTGAATTFPARTLQTVTINRAATGKKSVAVTTPCWLFGTDSYMEVADNALLDFGATESFTAIAVARITSSTVNQGILSKRNSTGVAVANREGWQISNNAFNIQDLTPTFVTSALPTLSTTALSVIAGVRNVSSDTITPYVNATAGTPIADTTVVSLANGYEMRVGRLSGTGTQHADMEGIAFALFRRALTQDEISLLNTYYQGLDLGVYQPPKYPTYARLPQPLTDGNLAYAQDSKNLLIAREGRWDGILTESSALLPVPADAPPGEKLAKQAVWWIDAQAPGSSDSGAVNLGWGGTALNAAQATAANQPKFLPFSGTPYVYSPGNNGNAISVPHVAGEQIGDVLDVRVDARLPSWKANTGGYIFAKSTSISASSTAWYFSIGTTGNLGFAPSDGTAFATNTASANNILAGLADNTRYRIRATYTRDTGAGQHAIAFWYSTDLVTPLASVTSWIQLGATLTAASIGTMVDAPHPIGLGSYRLTTAGPEGDYYGAAIIANGAVKLVIDTSVISSGSTYTFPTLTGSTATINRSNAGRKAVAVVAPVWLFGTDDYLEVADNDLLDFGATDSFTAVLVARRWNAESLAALTKANTIGSTIQGWALNTSTTAWRFTVGDGTRLIPQAPNDTLGAASTIVGVRNVTADTLTAYWNAAAGTPLTDTSTGTLANANTLRIGTTTTDYMAMEFTAAMIFRRALTATEIQLLSDYFKGRAA